MAQGQLKMRAGGWLAFGFVAIIGCLPALAQDLSKVEGTITVTQRYDIRRSVNGKYAGMVYGFSQGTWYLQAVAADGSRTVEGHYYLTGDSPLDQNHREKALSGELDAHFTMRPDGGVVKIQGGPAPFIRGFPMAPPRDAKPGDNWQGAAVLMMDPRNSGVWTAIPILIEYHYQGMATWNKQSVIELRAKFAIRYREDRRDPQGDPELKHAEGTRDATIYLDPDSKFPVFVREMVGHETWDFKDGGQIVNNGFILTFYRGVTPLEGGDSLADQRKKDDKLYSDELDKQKLQDVTVRQDPRGIAITLENLRFVADSPELLKGEADRLDKIVTLLAKVPPSKNILVVGHTAAVGSLESQQSLSFERAKRIVEELKKRGIDPGRLLFDGKGGSQPIGDNATDAGRAKNRRVELIILD